MSPDKNALSRQCRHPAMIRIRYQNGRDDKFDFICGAFQKNAHKYELPAPGICGKPSSDHDVMGAGDSCGAARQAAREERRSIKHPLTMSYPPVMLSAAPRFHGRPREPEARSRGILLAHTRRMFLHPI